MATINHNLDAGPLDIVLVGGAAATDLVIRCTNFRNASVQFRITAGGPIGTCDVYLGNNGVITTDVKDVTASTAMAAIAAGRMYERGVDTAYITFSLASAAGATVQVIPSPSGEASEGTTYVDGQAIASGAAAPSKVAIYDPTGVNGVAVETAGTDAGNNTQNSLSVSARMSAWDTTASLWKRLTLAATTGDGIVAELNRLRVISVGMAQNPAGTLDTLRSGLPAIDAIFTGLLGVAPVAKYDAAPTARGAGEKGPFQAAANGSLLTGINDGLTQNNVAVETAGVDNGNNTRNSLATSARLSAWEVGGAVWKRLQLSTTMADATAYTLDRLRVSAAILASNGTSLDVVRSYLAAELTTLTGMLTPLGYGQYKASPTALTEAQAGVVSLNSLHMQIQDLGTAIRGEDSTNDLLAVMDKPFVGTTSDWTLYTNPLGALVNGALILTGARNVGAIYVVNLSGNQRYFMLFDKATAPANPDVPKYPFSLPAGGTLCIGLDFFGRNGKNFALGLGFGVSTAYATYVVGGAGDALVFVHYK